MLVDSNGRTLASRLGPGGLVDSQLTASTVTLPLGPPLNDVYLKATAFRTRSQLADKFLVWAVVVLSLLIVWTLMSQMRHLRRRQEAEAARDRIFNLSLDILAVIDNHGRIVRLNPACARILGREPASLSGASLLDLVHPEDRAATSDELERIAEGGVGSAFENRCRRFNEDGTTEYRWLVWNFNPDLQTRGDKRLLYAVAHDITQRRARQYALQAETAFRRAMEDSMLTGMRVLDMQGRITYVNPAFCRMLGFDENDLLGATPPFPYWPRERHEESAAHLRRMLAGDTPPTGLEVRVRRSDGTDLDTRMYVSPLIEANGVQSGWMTSMTDITQSKRARQELAEAQERFLTVLDELDAAVSVCAFRTATTGRSRRAAVREPALPQSPRRRRPQPSRARRSGAARAGRRRRRARVRRALATRSITRAPNAGSRSARARSSGSTARRCACRSRPTSPNARRRRNASGSRKRRCS